MKFLVVAADAQLGAAAGS